MDNFVAPCAQKTGLDEATIRQGLWGDFYLDVKTKSIRKGAFDCGKKPLFVQMILDTVWTAYQAILIKKDKDMIDLLSRGGADPLGNSPGEAMAFLKAEIARWGAAVKRAGVKVD